MIGSLDNSTLLLVAGGLYVLLPASVWLVLRMPRQPAPLLWCAGGTVGGIGLVLIGLRGTVPDLTSYVAGQPLLVLGAVLLGQSLRLDLRRPWPWQTIGLGVVGYALILWLLLAQQQFATLGIVTRMVNLGAALSLVAAAWQVGRVEASRGARMIAFAYLVQVTGILGNLADAISQAMDSNLVANSRIGVTASLLTLLVTLAAVMGYLGLSLERMMRRNLELTRELVREGQWIERRESLVRMDRERILFLLADSLAHRITQPLTAALLHVEMGQGQLQQGRWDPTRQARWIGQVIVDIRRAADMIDRLREFIRPIRAQQSTVDLRRLIDDVEHLLRQEAIIRQVDVRFSLPDEPALVSGDAMQLTQALLQTARNALSASAGSRRHRVEVVLEASADTVSVTVDDSGPGLPEASRLAETSQPLPRLETLQGIGLFVVRSIVESHRGTLSVTRSALGGAAIAMSFPRVMQMPPHQPSQPTQRQASQPTQRQASQPTQRQASQPTQRQASPQTRSDPVHTDAA